MCCIEKRISNTEKLLTERGLTVAAGALQTAGFGIHASLDSTATAQNGHDLCKIAFGEHWPMSMFACTFCFAASACVVLIIVHWFRDLSVQSVSQTVMRAELLQF